MPKSVDLHPPIAADQDVAGLHVAVDDARARGPPASARAISAAIRAAWRGGSGPDAADDRREILAVDQLHDDERPGGVLAVVVHRDDVGVVQRGRVLAPPGGSATPKSGSRPYSGRRSLTATSRSSWLSCAR